MTWILLNTAITVAYCLICYTMDAKFQLAVAKVLTVIYSMLMTAMLIGIFLDRSQSLFYSVPQDSHSQAGSDAASTI